MYNKPSFEAYGLGMGAPKHPWSCREGLGSSGETATNLREEMQMKSRSSPTTFESIGVRPLINCRGTYTILSGSLALPQVVQATADATKQYVHLDELMDRVGARLAELTGAEWGLVTSGCAAALCQVTAACVAGADPEKMARLPDCTGMKDEIIVQKSHRTVYDHAIRMVGVKMIEVETPADLQAAISDRTAMLAILGNGAERGEISVREMAKIGHRHGIPVFVDAAAERPDVPNRYLEEGADVVAYSGGKCLRGPQASGLVLGRKDILQAAFLNGAPHHALGRPMKAGKEEIMGLLAAVEAWINGRDHEAEWKQWEGTLKCIQDALADVPTVCTEVVQPGRSNVAPTLSIWWDEDVLKITPREVQKELSDGDPRIEMPMGRQGLSVMPYMMESGEERIVARRLREILGEARGGEEDTEEPGPSANVAGQWKISTQYLLGESQHSVVLEQEGKQLSGCYRSQFSEAELEGTVRGNEVWIQTAIWHEASVIRYDYVGQVEGDTMRGTVGLGEYWTAEWTAQRIR